MWLPSFRCRKAGRAWRIRLACAHHLKRGLGKGWGAGAQSAEIFECWSHVHATPTDPRALDCALRE